jgi:hypothetical protein
LRGCGAILVEDLGDPYRSLAGAVNKSVSHRPATLGETSFQERHQAGRVSSWVRRFGDYDVVACHFALDGEVLLDPPNRGMEKE